ncbi:diguanylate cyclase [Actinoplanes sp. SE50]|uniref:putative bifunctional diguanylate cyclase/phosphodiesterase n=1 Tax=unclassified Actinoplanes TaxID=2626549 RepID=UPI00023ECA81|nr:MULTISPECIES: bifunctional diguanylate cyclase/phosphodiesterase [unclassified Actinoplanes]AEV82031.1 putative signaling protein [Actinoplanes sp. SE50/110]ATO80430.1 diguanylate cyclase [Actinoplanes sp. SE50]SLL97837.1 diguanylate cyclase [Actinoplanes sp. SE50/110]
MARKALLDRTRRVVDDGVVLASLLLLVWPAADATDVTLTGRLVPLAAALCLGLAMLLVAPDRPVLRFAPTAAALAVSGIRHVQGELAPGAVWLLLGMAVAVLFRRWAVAGSDNALIREMTSQRALLARQAYRDPLTGVGNRKMFLERADHELSAASRTMTAVIVVDLDGFRELNDEFGHEVGDGLLRAAADRLAANVRANDVVARLDGDEFVVLLPGVEDEQAAVAVAERVLTELHRPLEVDGIKLTVRASAGVAITAGGETIDHVLREADQALHRAKLDGGGAARRFDPALFALEEQRRKAEGDIIRALDLGEFEVHYQPIVDLDGEHTVGVEALIRWQHPEKGLVPPGLFLELAEQLGLLPRLGGWVLEEACRQAVNWQRQFPGFEMNVNLSASQLSNPNLVGEVRAVLERTGLEPEHLVLELTESVALVDLVESARILTELKELGVRIALDDFGTGFSSLSHLSALPVDVVKIDRSFVQAMPESGGASVAEAVLHIARTFNLAPVAEGVEDAAQAEWLRDLACGRAQGYHFARPMPALGVTELLDKQADKDVPLAS